MLNPNYMNKNKTISLICLCAKIKLIVLRVIKNMQQLEKKIVDFDLIRHLRICFKISKISQKCFYRLKSFIEIKTLI